MKKTFVTLIALLAIGYLLALRFSAAPPAGGDFTLRSPSGSLSLRGLRGQVVLVYFGYLSCPDVCPTSLSVAAKAMAALRPEEAAQVQLLFISVDPERDSVEATDRYARYFHPRFGGLGGAPEEIARVARQYGARYTKAPVASAVGYAVDHSADIYVVAPSGRLVGSVPHGAAPEDVTRAIRAARQERSP